jgi:hypothetical protein
MPHNSLTGVQYALSSATLAIADKSLLDVVHTRTVPTLEIRGHVSISFPTWRSRVLYMYGTYQWATPIARRWGGPYSMSMLGRKQTEVSKIRSDYHPAQQVQTPLRLPPRLWTVSCLFVIPHLVIIHLRHIAADRELLAS